MKLDSFVKHIDSLEKDTQPEWGIMTAQHMVEHLIVTLEICSGKREVECTKSEKELRAFRAFLMSDKPIPKGMKIPNVGEVLFPLRFSSLDEAKKVFYSHYDDFKQYFEDHPDSVLTNPAFGDLNYAEWQQFHKKHMGHHFRQFGLI